MSKTGVVVEDACIEVFNQIKLKHTLRYVTYVIQGDSTIVVDKQGDKTATYADFKKILTDSDPLYAVVDIEYSTEDGRPQSKLAFINWCPENTPVKKKMIYASSKDNLKRKLNGIHKEVQACDWDDVEEETMIKSMK